jgi:hypothetical protein
VAFFLAEVHVRASATPTGSVSQTGSAVPATQRDARPDQLDNTERPRPREKPIGAGQDASESEEEDELSASSLQGIHGHHERNGTNPVDGDGDAGHLLIKADSAASG